MNWPTFYSNIFFYLLKKYFEEMINLGNIAEAEEMILNYKYSIT